MRQGQAAGSSIRVGQERGAGEGGEVGFEDEDSGHLVDEVLLIEAAGAAGARAEERVGFVGGEALVEEMVRERGVSLFESLGEGQRFEGLRAGCAVGVQWVADDEGLYVVLADEAGDGFEIGAEVGAVEGEEGLRGEAKGIGDG